jgi:hypothetical protein
MEIMFNSFLEARSQIYDTNNQVRVDTETAGEKVKRIHKLYGLFKGVDGNNRQLAELTDKFGEFCKIIEVREFIFREIINELKSMHIHRNNRNDLYTLLSAMDSDYVFRYGYLHNHNISRKIFDDIFRQIKISTGNNANKTDGDENHGDEIQME